jgi:hypothetical protein
MSMSGTKLMGMAALALGLAVAQARTPVAAAEQAVGTDNGAGADENRLWWDTEQNPLLDIFQGSDAIHRPRQFLPIPKNRIDRFTWGRADHYWRFSGHINKGVLVYGDGKLTKGHPLVDNANSASRIRLETVRQKNAELAIRGIWEQQFAPMSTIDVSQVSRGSTDWTEGYLRRLEIWFDHTRYGRLWFGQGSMASDNSTMVDLSGTKVAGGAAVEDLAGGQFLRFSSSGELSDIRIRDVMMVQDGLGRLVRIRYDAPEFRGFTASASYGFKTFAATVDDPSGDVAIRYNHTGPNYQFEAAAAFAIIGTDSNQFSASASVLLDSGINVTAATSSLRDPDRVSSYFYAKLGYIANWLPTGYTALSADVHSGRNFVMNGSRSTSFGIQAVQNIDHWNTELYLGVRSYRYSEPTTSYEKSIGVLTGARAKF